MVTVWVNKKDVFPISKSPFKKHLIFLKQNLNKEHYVVYKYIEVKCITIAQRPGERA